MADNSKPASVQKSLEERVDRTVAKGDKDVKGGAGVELTRKKEVKLPNGLKIINH